MTLFRRKSRWPAELERRKPENAQTRRQIEEQQRELIARRSEIATQVTEDNERRIAQVEATVRGLASRL